MNIKKERKEKTNTGTKSNSTENETGVALENRSKLFFDNLEWLTTAETATYLRKFDPDGKPSLTAIHKLVSKGVIRRRKFQGRLYFKKNELSYAIEASGQ